MPHDPKEQGKKPPFPQKEQDHPGTDREMSPRPDYGEERYRGFGRLKERVAVITGADSGIGRAVALAFAREGADVVISYLNEHQDAQETRRLVESSGRRAALVAGDLAEESQCRRVIEETVRAFGRIHLLVNNAAYQGKAVEKFEELDAARIERTFRVNCVAPGPVWTPLVAQSFDREKLKEFGKNYPMERPAQPAELAPAYVFLASDESRYVNGEVLGVTGGKPLA